MQIHGLLSRIGLMLQIIKNISRFITKCLMNTEDSRCKCLRFSQNTSLLDVGNCFDRHHVNLMVGMVLVQSMSVQNLLNAVCVYIV